MIKKRFFLIVAIFCFLFLPSYALYETSIFEGWVDAVSNISINGDKFNFSVASEGKKLKVVLPKGYAIVIDEGKCKIDDYYNICFIGSNVSYHDYTADRDVYKAKITISEIIANMVLTRTIDNKDLFIGEETNIAVNFENNGDRAAKDVSYADRFDDSFAITKVDGCLISDNSVVWNGDLSMNTEKSCSYKVKGINRTSYKSKVELSYNNGREIKNITDSQTIKVNDYQIQVNASLKESEMGVGGENSLNITLTNINDDDRIMVSEFYVVVPHGINVINKYHLNEKDDRYSWVGGALDPEESKRFSLELSGERSGDYNITINIRYTHNMIYNEFKKIKKLKIIKPSLLIKPVTKPVLERGEESNLIISLENPSYIISFKDIKIKMASDIPNVATVDDSIWEIQPRETKKAFDIDFNAPGTYGDYDFDIDVEYKSPYGEVFQSKGTVSVSVPEPKKEGIVVEEVNKTEEAEELKAEVSGKEAEIEAIETEEGKEDLISEIRMLGPSGYFSILNIVVGILIVFVVIFVIVEIRKKQ